ncbi:chaperone NapD [Thiohalobacter sp. IOR34]|uniref:chaperone NapD n=1 Tax=Thiohalobacter sp. IOR34 TaxID=3057176 RepID=UPI0025B265F8|nr:chaperone NapD [Thiohalobacter sp. IOR34]WJW75362.1 chaperone NapD [Thiohalobacter sp. IOR34]
MNISGVLVRTRPEKVALVQTALEQLDGVEVHATTEDGRLIVTVEQADDRATASTVDRMQDLPGVIAASMVYHQFEDDELINESIEQEA